tara:strand:+ start:4765 stop:4968 length:204 start_codon:yes stop_codon:yes gene_type:complete
MEVNSLRDSVAFEAGIQYERRRVYELVQNRINLFQSLPKSEKAWSSRTYAAIIGELKLLTRVLDEEQ